MMRRFAVVALLALATGALGTKDGLRGLNDDIFALETGEASEAAVLGLDTVKPTSVLEISESDLLGAGEDEDSAVEKAGESDMKKALGEEKQGDGNSAQLADILKHMKTQDETIADLRRALKKGSSTSSDVPSGFMPSTPQEGSEAFTRARNPLADEVSTADQSVEPVMVDNLEDVGLGSSSTEEKHTEEAAPVKKECDSDKKEEAEAAADGKTWLKEHEKDMLDAARSEEDDVVHLVYIANKSPEEIRDAADDVAEAVERLVALERRLRAAAKKADAAASEGDSAEEDEDEDEDEDEKEAKEAKEAKEDVELKQETEAARVEAEAVAAAEAKEEQQERLAEEQEEKAEAAHEAKVQEETEAEEKKDRAEAEAKEKAEKEHEEALQERRDALAELQAAKERAKEHLRLATSDDVAARTKSEHSIKKAQDEHKKNDN